MAVVAELPVEESPASPLRRVFANPVPILDALALALTPVLVADGDVIFRRGDSGDRFFVVDAGGVEVLIDGRHVVHLGPAMPSGRSRCCTTCRA